MVEQRVAELGRNFGELTVRLARMRLVRGLLLLTCIASVLVWIGVFDRLKDDSWSPMILAFDVLHGPKWDKLFETVFFEKGSSFQYPPTSILFIELVNLFVTPSKFSLNVINLFLFVAGAILFAVFANRLFEDKLPTGTAFSAGCIAFLVYVFYFPNIVAFGYGQIQVLITGLFTLTCLLLWDRRDAAAGAILAVASAIKPQLGPLLLISALYRRWNFTLGFVAAGAIIGIVSLILYGVHNHFAYLEVIKFLTERGETWYLNASVNGIANRILGNGDAFNFVYTDGIAHSVLPPYHPTVHLVSRIAAVGFMILAFVAPVKRQDNRSVLLHFAFANVCLLLASPIAWVHHYGVLLPIYLLALHAILHGVPGRPQLLKLGGLAISFVLTGIWWPKFEGMQGWATLLQAPVFFGALLLLVLLLIELIARNRAFAATQTADPLPQARPQGETINA